MWRVQYFLHRTMLECIIPNHLVCIQTNLMTTLQLDPLSFDPHLLIDSSDGGNRAKCLTSSFMLMGSLGVKSALTIKSIRLNFTADTSCAVLVCTISIGNTSHVEEVNVALHRAYRIDEHIWGKIFCAPKTNNEIKSFSRQSWTCTIDIIFDTFNQIGNSPRSLIKIQQILHFGLKLVKLVPVQCISETDTFSSCS